MLRPGGPPDFRRHRRRLIGHKYGVARPPDMFQDFIEQLFELSHQHPLRADTSRAARPCAAPWPCLEGLQIASCPRTSRPRTSWCVGARPSASAVSARRKPRKPSCQAEPSARVEPPDVSAVLAQQGCQPLRADDDRDPCRSPPDVFDLHHTTFDLDLQIPQNTRTTPFACRLIMQFEAKNYTVDSACLRHDLTIFHSVSAILLSCLLGRLGRRFFAEMSQSVFQFGGLGEMLASHAGVKLGSSFLSDNSPPHGL